MKTAFAKSPHRSPFYTKFATPLVLDSPRHCGFGTILLSRGKHLLGTSHDCSVQLRAGDVQPRHAMIVVGEHRTVVKALDPRTWVNDGPVSEMALRPGDRLSIGPLTFRVRAADADELAAIEAADEQTCTGDFSFEVATDTEQSTTAASSFEAAPVGTTTVSRVAVPSAPADVLATPVEFPIVAEVAAVTPPVAMSRVAQQPAPVEPTTPVVDVPTGKVIRPDQESTAESTSSATLDFKLHENQRTLSELQQPNERRSAA